MAQVTGRTQTYIRAKNEAVVIPAAGNTVLLDLTVAGLAHLGVEVKPTVNNLDGFLVEVKFSPDADWVTLTSSITSTPAGLILAASGTLATLAAAATGWLIMDVRGLYGVRISASGSVDDTTSVSAYAGGYAGVPV